MRESILSGSARRLRFLTGCLLLLLSAVSGHAQDKWQNVQALPPGTRLHVAADAQSGGCTLASVTEDSLICTRGKAFPRASIKTIKLTRRGVSTLGGVGIGAGAGLLAGVGVAHGKQGEFTIVSNADVWGAGAAVGGVIGGGVGLASDFLRGPTVYRRR